MKSKTNGIVIIDTGINFRIELHRIIGDDVFNVKHIEVNMNQAIRLDKDLRAAINRAKKRNIKNFGCPNPTREDYSSAEDGFEFLRNNLSKYYTESK